MKTFGKANEFYRVRLLTKTEDQLLDFQWRDDILYSKPEDNIDLKTNNSYLIQLIVLDTNEKMILEKFKERIQAQQFLSNIEENLHQSTKNEFEDFLLDLTNNN